MANRSRVDDLERAFRVLRDLVYEEYPSKYDLAQIAYYWGTDTTPEDMDALRRLEQDHSLSSDSPDGTS